MNQLITKELNYDLSQGEHVFDNEKAVKAPTDKCSIEVLGTDMDGEITLQVSGSGSVYSEIADFVVTATGNYIVSPICGITPGSFLKIKVKSGISGTLSMVKYLFG